MKRAQIVLVLLTLTGAALVGCDRRVVGETYEGQLAGRRSMLVTGDAPPRSATPTGAPEAPPASTRVGSVRESDPSTRALLASSGARILLRETPRPRPIAPPPPPPAPVEPAAIVVPPAPPPAVAPPVVRPIRALAPRPPAPAAPAAPAPAAQP